MKILTEDAQYTSRKKAVEYLKKYDFFSSKHNVNIYGGGENDENKAIDYYLRIYLRNKITSLRSTKGGKYILGCVRIIHDDGLPKSEYQKLNKIVSIIVGDEHLYKSIDQNFNDMNFDELYDKLIGYMVEFGEDFDGGKDEVTNEKYRVEKIESFEEATKFAKYVDWCITKSDYMFRNYLNNKINEYYFVIRDDFKKYPDTTTWINKNGLDNCNYKDEYGSSLICVIVGPGNKLVKSVSRYNHKANKGSVNPEFVWTEAELGDMLGCSFKKVFINNKIDKNDFHVIIKKYNDLLEDVTQWYLDNIFSNKDLDNYSTNGSISFDGIDEECLDGNEDISSVCEELDEGKGLYRIRIVIENGDNYFNFSRTFNVHTKKFETPWCKQISLIGNIIVYGYNNPGNLEFYIKKIGEDKTLTKYPITTFQKFKNTLIVKDSNGKISALNHFNGEFIELGSYFNNWTVLNYGLQRYCLVNVSGDIFKFKILDTEKCVCGEEIYYSPKSRYITSEPTLIEDLVLCSNNKDLTNPFILNITNNEKIDIPFIGSCIECCGNYIMINSSKFYELKNGEKGRSVVINVDTNKIIFDEDNIYEFIDYGRQYENGLILGCEKRNIIFKDDEIFLDGVDVYPANGKYCIIEKNGKYAFLKLTDFTLYYEPEIDTEWFKSYKYLGGSDTLCALGSNGEIYEVV